MFYRENLTLLTEWKKSKSRKPFVICGAKQTGKTALVEQFSKSFSEFASINLEHSQAVELWNGSPSTKELLRHIEVFTETKIIPGKTLLFVDEIQQEPSAIQSLQSLQAELPSLHVLAASSLIENSKSGQPSSLSKDPVSFMHMHPLRFNEFLGATRKHELLQSLNEVRFDQTLSKPIAELAHANFQTFCFVGGMPKAVATFLESDHPSDLAQTKKDLIAGFEKEITKYASRTRAEHLRFLLHHAAPYVGERIKYAGFANSEYKSRQISEAFDLLQCSMLTQRISPTYQTSPPLQVPSKASPKLLFVDVGLVTHLVGANLQSLRSQSLHSAFNGSVAQQIVGQQLLSSGDSSRSKIFFWHRNQPGTTAEVDYCIVASSELNGPLAIPIEIKSGKTGRLRSLFEFIDAAPHNFAVRIYDGPLHWEMAKTRRGKTFELLSVPFYLTYRLRDLIEPWITQNAC